MKAPKYIIYTDLLDDFRKDEFKALLEEIERMGCLISKE